MRGENASERRRWEEFPRICCCFERVGHGHPAQAARFLEHEEFVLCKGTLMTQVGRGSKMAIVILLCGVIAGCAKQPTGPGRGVVHGKITLDGQPVTKGMVSFAPIGTEGGAVWSTVIRDGQYTSGQPGPIVGKSRVGITAPRQNAAPLQDAKSDWKSGYVEAIPASYNAKSTLAVEVKPGDNVFDFELKSR
jgi:hypothetical protein